MSKSSVRLSIIIATFNSENTLTKVLESIALQALPRKDYEIIIVDGGSKDDTLKIAKGFGCKVISNPRTEPVYGKFLGYKNAKGRYIMFLDSDEVIENKQSLEKRLSTFAADKRIKAVVGSGYKSPRGYPFVNQYINEYGDPFTFFIYRLSKDSRFFLKTMRKRYRVFSENKEFVVFNLSRSKTFPIVELAAGGSVFDGQFLKKGFPETLKKTELLPHYFYLVYEKFPYLAISKNDALIHYSADTFRKLLVKILWRIKNNIYHIKTMGQSGFAGREKYQPSSLRIKKYLFIPYSYSIFFPLVDSLSLSLIRKDFRYFVHFLLCVYTATLIIFHYALKTLGVKPKLRSYDESKVIKKLG